MTTTLSPRIASTQPTLPTLFSESTHYLAEKNVTNSQKCEGAQLDKKRSCVDELTDLVRLSRWEVSAFGTVTFPVSGDASI